MKTKELLKRALKNPELFTPGELEYFRLMKKQRKLQKGKEEAAKKAAKAEANSSDYLR
jgi:hypothetical protein